jgi:hypothetical protein
MCRETNRSGRSQNTGTWSYPATRISLSRAWQNSQSEFRDQKTIRAEISTQRMSRR